MKKKILNTKLFLNKETISNLTMNDLKGKGLPTQYNNLSEALTYINAPGTTNCGEVCWNLGTRGLCTDEMATC